MLNRKELQKIMSIIKGGVDLDKDPFLNSAETILKMLKITKKTHFFMEYIYPFVGEEATKTYKMEVGEQEAFPLYLTMAFQQSKVNDADKFPLYVSFLGFDADDADVKMTVLQVANEEEEMIIKARLCKMGIDDNKQKGTV